MGELLKRGFEARFSDCKEHVLLVRAGGSTRKPVRVKTSHGAKSARFFVARNRGLAARFRRPLIDANPVEQ